MRRTEVDRSVGFICKDCNKDVYYFNRRNRAITYKKNCIVCNKSSHEGIIIEDFVFTLNRKIPDHYHLVSDSQSDVISLKEVIKRFTIDNQDVLEKVADLLSEENADFFKRNGIYKSHVDQTFIENCKHQAKVDWDELSRELKHSRRFTHMRATVFFENLIRTCIYSIDKKHEEENDEYNSVKRVIKKGTTLYRGRLTSDDKHRQSFQRKPSELLGAPPSLLAANNRMSPPGISFMYTANNPQTAIAEIRPYVGDTIAVGSFITKKTLTFFDFTLLDSAKLKSASILTSPKQDKFYQHGYLLNTLHELISKPFRATSLNYIQTQMFAETIRNYDNGMFDGIIFKSSQLEGGINYVIFGDETEGDSDSIEYNVEFDTQTGVEFYQVEAMTPSIKEVGIHSRNSDNILVNV
ncbi:hypothetical protein BCS92_19300 [Vibrio tasmaniensis]|nr:hypothetical protein BCS92_19300 [Vibrio tasmaniensis]